MISQRLRVGRSCVAVTTVATVLWISVAAVDATELFIGTASVSITPPQPVALSGQRRTRIARAVESPVTATALALETRDGEKVLDQAIMVSCDLVAIREGIQDRFRERVKARLPDFDINKLFMAATHTHTAPVTRDGIYVIPEAGVIKPLEYVDFLDERLEDAVVQAWQNRQPGGVSWGLGHALVAHNRRAVYEGGNARMYGGTEGPSFRGIEGYEDHYVDVLFFFNPDRELTAVAVNVPCPAQEVESREKVNADFWHETRLLLRKRFGENLQVIAWTGAGGDQSPHLMWYKRAEERMRALRGLTRLEEIARRIDLAVGEAYQGAKQDIRFDAPLVHQVKRIQLPVRMVTEQEFAEAKAFCDAAAKEEKPDPRKCLERMWSQGTVDRYAQQKTHPQHAMELHAIRLGDVAVCTNPFELYTEFGVRIKARSKAVQTFVVQLACDSAAYLPTVEAVRGGSYSTAVYSNLVGPEGGDSLVEQTVEAINAMWD
ncbi:MAG: hypothetical protein ACC628_07320 [Pirellulaceae bacterium]